MKIALLVLLFLVGTVSSAYQAMKFLERRNQRKTPPDESRNEHKP